jgi:hypothetical protein
MNMQQLQHSWNSWIRNRLCVEICVGNVCVSAIFSVHMEKTEITQNSVLQTIQFYVFATQTFPTQALFNIETTLTVYRGH